MFACSTSLIYKPRSLAPEAWLSTLLNALNGDNPPHALRPVQCWDQGTYGWMEDVVPQPCGLPAQLHAFYWRAGVLLALVYLARGVDMHRENLVAAGEYPVLIDLETLWHPQEHINAGASPLANSVFRTGFLPLEDSAVGATYELSGLSRRTQDGDNTLPSAHNLPIFEGVGQPASPFLSDILTGFEWVGRQTFEGRRERESLRERLLELKDCPRRRILRSTAQYRTAIEKLIAPWALQAQEWTEDTLTRCFALGGPPLEAAERRALQELDIPYVEQASIFSREQDDSLPVQSLEDFSAQKPFIIRAFVISSEPRESTD